MVLSVREAVPRVPEIATEIFFLAHGKIHIWRLPNTTEELEMILNLPSPSSLAAECVPLERDIYGKPRLYLPAVAIGVESGSDLARKVGLTKNRGKSLAPGFVVQSHYLEGDLTLVIAGLEGSDPQTSLSRDLGPRHAGDQ